MNKTHITLRDIFSSKIFTLSNLLSISRIGLGPGMYYCFQLPEGSNKQLYGLLGIIIFAIVSDFFDGFFARRFNQETLLGCYLDPVADKCTVISAFIVLYVYRDLPLWLVLLVAIREIISVLVGIYLLFEHGMVARPNIWGKIGVTLAFLLSLLYILQHPSRLYVLAIFVIVLGVGLLTYSRAHYEMILLYFKKKSIF